MRTLPFLMILFSSKPRANAYQILNVISADCQQSRNSKFKENQVIFVVVGPYICKLT